MSRQLPVRNRFTLQRISNFEGDKFKWSTLYFFAGGQHHTLILTNDNKCYAIGRKDYGRLGIGEIEEELIDKVTLIKKLDDLKIVQLDCGECCSFAVTDDGKAYSWGMGSNQQLGVGSDDDQFEPVLLTGAQVRDRQVIRISSGGQHTLFLAADKNTSTNGNHKDAGKRKSTNGTKANDTKEKAKPDDTKEPTPVDTKDVKSNDTQDSTSDEKMEIKSDETDATESNEDKPQENVAAE